MGKKKRGGQDSVVTPLSADNILRSFKVVDNNIKLSVSTHFMWQILSRKLVDRVSEESLGETLLDSYVVPEDQRPRNLIAMLNNKSRRTVYLVSEQSNMTFVLDDDDITRKVCVARTAYSVNDSLWTSEWLKGAAPDNRMRLSGLLMRRGLGLVLEMPYGRLKKNVVDGRAVNLEIARGNGYLLVFKTTDSEDWRLGVVEKRFSDGSMTISSEFKGDIRQFESQTKGDFDER